MQATAAHVTRITLEELRRQGEALFVAHYDEVALHKRVMQLAPNWQAYEQLDAAGALIVLGAFVGDALVGYSVLIVGPHLHYRHLRYAQVDVLFLTAEHRRNGTGKALIYASEQAAAAGGAKLVTWHAKPGTAMEAVLTGMHYGVQDVIFSKEL